MAPWYDSRAGIEASVQTLDGLNKLLSARSDAYRQRGERLDEWIALGRIRLDTFGQSMVLMEGYSSNRVKVSDEPVLHISEVSGFSASTGLTVPETKHRCPRCGNGWDISNWYDSTTVTSDSKLALGEVGKTHAQVQQELSDADPTRDYLLRTGVQNDKNIDLRPDPKWADNNYMKDYPINHNGFIDVDPDYVVVEGDKLYHTVFEYYHPNCLAEKKAESEQEYFAKMFADAGYQSVDLTAVPNEYCRIPSCCPPWYEVETEVGQFKIGWRKRVINIVWPKKLNALTLFGDEDVTKWETGIHAWGTEKGVEYLKAIRTFALEE
ncbi:MAG: hypothetical protein ACWGQW_01745 [bacterium]